MQRCEQVNMNKVVFKGDQNNERMRENVRIGVNSPPSKS